MTKQLTARGITGYGTSFSTSAGPERQPIHLSSIVTDGPANTVDRHVTIEVMPQNLLAMIPGLARFALIGLHPELAKASSSGYWKGKAVDEAIKAAVEAGIEAGLAEALKLAQS